jgi:hypothetical protein
MVHLLVCLLVQEPGAKIPLMPTCCTFWSLGRWFSRLNSTFYLRSSASTSSCRFVMLWLTSALLQWMDPALNRLRYVPNIIAVPIDADKLL